VSIGTGCDLSQLTARYGVKYGVINAQSTSRETVLLSYNIKSYFYQDEKTGEETNFFWDQKRRIDLVLVYEEDNGSGRQMT
jgi:hypothetical protein